MSFNKYLIGALLPLVLAGSPQKTSAEQTTPRSSVAQQQINRDDLEVLINKYLETFPEFSEFDAFSLASRKVPIEYALATKDLKFNTFNLESLEKNLPFKIGALYEAGATVEAAKTLSEIVDSEGNPAFSYYPKFDSCVTIFN